MLKILKGSFFLVLIMINVSAVRAQTDNVSPYSRYGIGELRHGSFTPFMSMGGTGIAFYAHNMANNMNPASYSELNLVSFAAGVRSDFVKYSTSNLSSGSNYTNLSYLNLAFPLRKDTTWGLSFGLMPYSSVGYSITATELLFDDITINRFYEGSGGYNQVYLGTGFKIGNRISIGANAHYIFGSIDKIRRLEFPGTSATVNTRVSSNTSVSDLQVNAGMQVKLINQEKQNLILGLVAGLPNKMSATQDFVALRYADNGTVIDTAYAREGVSGSINLPLHLGAGLSYLKRTVWRERDELMIGADYTMQDWSEFKSFGISDSLSNSYKASVGAQYVPDQSLQSTYFQRMYFRIGFRYHQTYLEINNNALQEYGITFGLGLPMKPFGLNRAPSYINLGVELGQRGTTDNNLIQEQFARIYLGFTLNDNSWFRKRRYD